MPTTRDKVQKVLSEVRTLVLGAQLLLGFTYQAGFRPGFEKLPSYAKALDALSLSLLLVTVACLIAPSSFHRIAEDGEATPRQLAYSKAMLETALVPFALSLGINLFVATENAFGTLGAFAMGGAGAAVALLFWFGVPLMQRQAGD